MEELAHRTGHTVNCGNSAGEAVRVTSRTGETHQIVTSNTGGACDACCAVETRRDTGVATASGEKGSVDTSGANRGRGAEDAGGHTGQAGVQGAKVKSVGAGETVGGSGLAVGTVCIADETACATEVVVGDAGEALGS